MSWLLENLSTALFLLGIALLTSILLRRWWRYYGRRKKSEGPLVRVARPAGKAADDNPLPLADAPPEITRWQVEMHQTARDLKAELDSKIGVLRQLVLMAHQEAERLEAALARAEKPAAEPDRSPASQQELLESDDEPKSHEPAGGP